MSSYLASFQCAGCFIEGRLSAQTHQVPGFSSINLLIRSLHSLFCNTMTSIPRCLRYASPPTNVLFSPITTRATLYKTQAPVHISHGDKEVYIVAPLYAEAGSLPEFSRVEISAFLCNNHDPRQSSHTQKASSARDRGGLHVELATLSALACCDLYRESSPPWTLDRHRWGLLLLQSLPSLLLQQR